MLNENLTTRQNRLMSGIFRGDEDKELNYIKSLVEAKYESTVGEDVRHSYSKREVAVKVYLGVMRFCDAIDKILMAHPKLNKGKLSRIENDRLVTLRNKIRKEHADYYVRNELEGYGPDEEE